MSKDRRLGRGLAALLGAPLDDSYAETSSGNGGNADALTDGAGSVATANPDTIRLSVFEIDDNPFQPRRDFSEPEIASLTESLKEHDMLQPILVRRMNGRYQLISGERRLRAAIQAGWTSVPARIREADDRLVAELAIVENLQRKDLNPIEKAMSFKRYLDQHRCTQEDLAQRLKIDRSTIANLMRLLELPEPILSAVRSGELSAGHARALLPLGDEREQIELARRIREEGMSVRAIENLVQELVRQEEGQDEAIAGRIPAKAPRRSSQLTALEQELKLALGTKVDIKSNGKGKGKITIHFEDHDEFERLRATLLGDDSPNLRNVG